MDNLPGRDTQTIVKHEILKGYLDAWAGIITNGLRAPYARFLTRASGSTFGVRFVYVDCFAFKGRYADSHNRRGWVEGSPLIGVQALDKAKTFAKEEVGFTLQTYTILFEEDEENFRGLLESF